jgi:hypothetical protein
MEGIDRVSFYRDGANPGSASMLRHNGPHYQRQVLVLKEIQILFYGRVRANIERYGPLGSLHDT